MRKTLALAALTVAALALAACPPPTSESPIEVVTLPSPESPLVAVRLMFSVGSIHDPAGKEGLAALTALMVGEAGTAKRDYKALVEAQQGMDQVRALAEEARGEVTGKLSALKRGQHATEAYTAID